MQHARRFAPVYVALLVFSFVPQLHAIALGDSRGAVLKEFGPPSGEVETNGLSVLIYPRGEIRLREGEVTAINLVSEEELSARLTAEDEEMERIEAARAGRLARLEAEGRDLFAAKTADPDFLRLPASEQLRFWRSFASRFPMIPIEGELAGLRDRLEQENLFRDLDRASENRIAELEARVAAAEERAANAERQANAIAYFSPRSSGYYHRPPIVIVGPGHRQPRHPQRPRNPEAPHADPMSAARAQVMGEYEAARSAVYSGRTP